VPRARVPGVLLNPSPRDTAREIVQTVASEPAASYVLQLRFADAADRAGLAAARDARQTDAAAPTVLPLADFLWLGDAASSFSDR